MELTDGRKARIARCLRLLGFEATHDNIEQFAVFEEAINIYTHREKIRGGVWKEFSVEDASMHVRSKGQRMKGAAGSLHIAKEAAVGKVMLDAYDKEIKDSALDAINYAAFAERHRQAGRLVEQEEI